ncbi:PAS domain S-box protein [Azohydromonas caseinilytica]|uniref:histidine kinase n=1 Tax=Azohydromonas caseinilytica TaxID=2728836 RepID=A0A848FAA5_9BURK|nr:PAS domain S-box protein [Azohydromonas caseinilytica]NML17097.1 PAS domain S-box protein [Azohydromonas caseinilytica]
MFHTFIAHEGETSARDQRLVLGLCAALLFGGLALLPRIATPWTPLPHLSGLYAVAVAIADFLTYALLRHEARESRAVRVLALAYLYGGLMALLHLLHFPGAVLPGRPVLGSVDGAVGWLYQAWQLGFMALLLWGVRTQQRAAPGQGRRGLGEAGVAAAVLGLLTLAHLPGMPSYFSGAPGVFPAAGLALSLAAIGAALLAVGLILRGRLLSDPLYLGLCVVLWGNAIGLGLQVVAGQRYTAGWYLGRIEHALSSLVLLVLLLKYFVRLQVEARFRAIADSAPVLIWQADANSTVFVNEEYARFVGKPAARLLGMGWAEAIHPGDAAAYLAAYQAAYERRARFEAQFRLRRQDGEYRWLKTVGLPQAERDGRFGGYVGSSFDVTDMKRAEEALRASEEWFREVADAAPAILWVTDAQGLCTFLSRRWRELTGQPAEAVLGLGWVRAVHPEDQVAVEARFKDALARREPFELDYRVRTADGGWRWCIDLGVPRLDPQGRFLGYVGSVVDITERKQAEMENSRLNAALQEADRRKDDFLATLAHELRNPLAPLRTGLEILRRAPDSAAAQRALPMMQRQLTHIVRLIDDLMDVARITQGRLALQPVPLDLRRIVGDAVEAHQGQVEAAGQRLGVVLPPEAVPVRGDATRLGQAIGNLLGNASKYSPPGSAIEVSLSVRGAATALVEVRDSGLGLPRERIETAFERFSTLNRELQRLQPGLGIGLSVVRSLVEMHGGRAWAHSEGLGHGASFYVELPLLPSGEPASAGEGVEARLQPLAVLLVDDNRDAAELLGEELRLDGHRVAVVHDPHVAVAAACRHRPDVVFLDIAMPGLDGYEVARRLRAVPELRQVLLVALTGFGGREDRGRVKAAGFDAHLVKPASAAQIGALLRQRARREAADGTGRPSAAPAS